MAALLVIGVLHAAAVLGALMGMKPGSSGSGSSSPSPPPEGSTGTGRWIAPGVWRDADGRVNVSGVWHAPVYAPPVQSVPEPASGADEPCPAPPAWTPQQEKVAKEVLREHRAKAKAIPEQQLTEAERRDLRAAKKQRQKEQNRASSAVPSSHLSLLRCVRSVRDPRSHRCFPSHATVFSGSRSVSPAAPCTPGSWGNRRTNRGWAARAAGGRDDPDDPDPDPEPVPEPEPELELVGGRGGHSGLP
jgi:hypothetical protein